MKYRGFHGAAVIFVVLSLLLWPLTGQMNAMHYRVLGMACFYGILSASWNISALTGVISLGHAAFFGLGAYGSALASHYWQISPYMSICLGATVGAAYGLVWAVVFKPLRGASLALATLASVEIPKVIIDNWDSVTSGSLGIVGISSLPPLVFRNMMLDIGESLELQYYLLLILMLVAGFLHWKSIDSSWGWSIRAIRENEAAAAALGIDVFRRRTEALLLSSLLTGFCGALYGHIIGIIEPALVFSLHMSAIPLVLSIFGGRYTFHGPLLGALILYPLDQLLFHAWLPSGHAILYGLVIMTTILFFPHGIGAWVRRRLELAWS
jgi:branched-chain amino acid transport system permease protein